MAEMKYLNDAVTSLASPLSDVATSAEVSSSAAFPVLGAGDWFWATLRRASDGAKENVRVTAVAGTTWTIEREAVAYAFSAGDGVYQRVNAELIDDLRRPDMRALGMFAAAGGTADVMTATLDYPARSLVDGMDVSIRAVGANTVTTPTLNLDGLGAKTITRLGNSALIVGDIVAAGHELRLRYRASTDKWELLNPSYSITYVDSIPSYMLTLLDDTSATAARVTLGVSDRAVANRTALKALTPSETQGSIYINGRDSAGDGGEGQIIWMTGDFSSEVTADSNEGVWFESDVVASTSGAWKRDDDGTLNSKWFGLTASTTASNAAAIINSMQDVGDRIYIPEGEYNLAPDVLTITRSGVSLYGDKASEAGTAYATSGTIFNCIGVNATDVFINIDGSPKIDNVRIKGISLSGNSIGIAISGTYFTNCEFEQCIINDFDTCIAATNSAFFNIFMDLKLFNFDYGFNFTTGVEDSEFTNVFCRGYRAASVGFFVSYYQQLNTFINCDFSDCYQNVKIQIGLGNPVTNFIGCTFEQGNALVANSRGFYINTAESVIINMTGCRLFYTKTDAYSPSAVAFEALGVGGVTLNIKGTKVTGYPSAFNGSGGAGFTRITGDVETDATTLLSGTITNSNLIDIEDNERNLLSNHGVYKFTHDFTSALVYDLSALGVGNSAIVEIVAINTPDEYAKFYIAEKSFFTNGANVELEDTSAYFTPTVSINDATFTSSTAFTGIVTISRL